jgi:hypothetical protein
LQRKSDKTGHSSKPAIFFGPSAGRFSEVSLYIDGWIRWYSGIESISLGLMNWDSALFVFSLTYANEVFEPQNVISGGFRALLSYFCDQKYL